MNQPDPSLRTLSRFALPIFVDNILRILMGNVIIMLLGRLSDGTVAAVGTANQIFNMMIMLYTMFGASSGIILNQRLGAGKRKDAADITVLVMGAGLAFGLVCSLLVHTFASDILRAIGLSEDLIAEGAEYLRIVGGFSFLYAMYYLSVSICRSYGYARFPMYVAVVMNLIHMAGSALFILRPFDLPASGAAGVALSASLGVFVALIPLFVVLVRRIGFRIYFRDIGVSVREVFASLMKIAIPSGTEAISYNVGQLVVTAIVAPMGTMFLTVRIIVRTLSTFFFMGSFSISQGGQIISSHLMGAGRSDDVYHSTLRNWKITLGLNVLLTTIGIILAKPLIGLYTTDPEIVKIGAVILAVDLLVEIGRAGNMTFGHTLRGVGDPNYTVRISLPSVWILNIGMSFVLGRWLGFGLIGVWFATAADECFRSLLVFRRWKSRIWEKKFKAAHAEKALE